MFCKWRANRLGVVALFETLINPRSWIIDFSEKSSSSRIFYDQQHAIFSQKLRWPTKIMVINNCVIITIMALLMVVIWGKWCRKIWGLCFLLSFWLQQTVITQNHGYYFLLYFRLNKIIFSSNFQFLSQNSLQKVSLL